MKKIYFLILAVLVLTVQSCSKSESPEPEPAKDLKLSLEGSFTTSQMDTCFTIDNGNDFYKVTSSDDEIAFAELRNGTVQVFFLSNEPVSITVEDVVTGQIITVDAKSTHPRLSSQLDGRIYYSTLGQVHRTKLDFGVPPYRIPMSVVFYGAKGKIEGDEIVMTAGNKPGNSRFDVTDSRGTKISLHLDVVQVP